MTAVYRLLLVAICSSPFLVLLSSVPQRQVLVLAAVFVLIGTIATATSSAIRATIRDSYWLMALGILLVLWMALQAAPNPIGILNHSIWRSAAAALQDNLWGSVSIDPAVTFKTIILFLSYSSIFLAALIIGRTRHQANIVFLVVSGVSALICVEQLATRVKLSTVLDPGSAGPTCAFAVILNTAMLLRMTEAVRTRSTREKSGLGIATLVLFGVSTLISYLALAVSASPSLVFAAAMGAVVLATIFAIRWLRGGSTSSAALGFIPLAICTIALLGRPNWSSYVLSRFQQVIHPEPDSIISQMLHDNGVLGSGAGTFDALLPIYQIAGGSEQASFPAFLRVLIELGWTATAVLGIGLIYLIVTMSYGAVIRGRDAFIPAAGASCCVIFAAAAFSDSPIFAIPNALLLAAAAGVGFSQRVGLKKSPPGLDRSADRQ